MIGGGPAGYVAAISAIQLNGKVVLVEVDEVGGTCLNRECIPTKALLETVKMLKLLNKMRSHGLEAGDVRFNVKNSIARSRGIVNKIVNGVKYLLESYDVNVIKGRRVILNPTTVKVVLGINGKNVITSDEFFTLEDIPGRVLVIGGRAVGVELSTIPNGLGVKTILVGIMEQLIPGEDRDIAKYLERNLRSNGIKFYTRPKVLEIKSHNGKVVHVMKPDGSVEKFNVVFVVVATGRKPNVENLGVEAVNVNVERGAIVVEEHMRTSTPNIYAAGDVVGGYMLAHVASHEGMVAAENVMGLDSKISYDSIPRCIYSIPEVSSVGLSEGEAISRGFKVSTGKFMFTANGRALTMDETEGYVKMIVDSETRRTLGVQIIGAYASELITEAVFIIKNKLTVDGVSQHIHPHPTLSEAL